MGRSQIKYRPNRGGGQGGSARGGRGGSSEKSRRGGDGRAGGRALESNAFRYAEREDDDDDANDGGDVAAAGADVGMRRQFFAGEQNYREMGNVKESYFRTKAMQQWDADEDEEAGAETESTALSVGVMELAWIAQQLATLPRSIRYQIDPKYCIDFDEEDPIEQNDTGARERVDGSSSISQPQLSGVVASKPPAEHAHSPKSALDDLLALSSAVASVVEATPPPLAASQSAAPENVSAPIPDGAEENLEDWLDDVLDM